MGTTTNNSNYHVEVLEGYFGPDLSNSCVGNIGFYPTNKFYLSKLITYRAMLLYCLATSVCKQFAKICDSAQMTIKASYDQILTFRRNAMKTVAKAVDPPPPPPAIYPLI